MRRNCKRGTPYGRALFTHKNTATDIYCNRAGRIHPPAIYVIAYDYSLCRSRRVAAPLQKGIEEIKSWGKSDKFVLQALNFGVPPSRLPCREAVIGRLCPPPETPDCQPLCKTAAGGARVCSARLFLIPPPVQLYIPMFAKRKLPLRKIRGGSFTAYTI